MKTQHWPIAKDNSVFYLTDSDYHDAYDQALSRTNGGKGDKPMRRFRYFTIPQAIRNTALIAGDACEIGVYRGLSAWLAAYELQRLGKTITLYLCDSFEGLSEPTQGDEPIWSKCGKGTSACDEKTVRANLSEYDFIEYHPGWIPEQFPALADKTFCYIHLDVNLYQPTKDSIEFLWPRLNKGGIALLDDYGAPRYPGTRRAIDEFFSNRFDYILMEQPSGQAIAVKL